MRKISTILMTLCVISMSVYGQTNLSSAEDVNGIVEPNTASVMEDVSSTKTIPEINVQDELTGKSLNNPGENDHQSGYIVKRGERPPIDIQAVPDDAYEKGILKIKFNESFTSHLDNNPVYLSDDGAVVFNISSVDLLNEQYKPTGFKKLFECGAFSPEYTDRHRAWGFHLWYTLYFDEKTDIKEMVFAYEQLTEVLIAEPEYKKVLSDVEPTTNPNKSDDNSGSSAVDWTPNDPSYGVQWHYHNTGQQSGTVDSDIDLPEAWNLETGNSNVIVAVIDGGIQHNHPDITGNMWSGIGWDFVNNNATIEPHYHGTHVAGTVAAESNNGIGVAGVAGGTGSNDGVRLMTCQVFPPSGSGGGFELAPVYAADNDACISQNSWNYTSPGYFDVAVLDAIDYFNTNGGGTALSGGITIFSAGNFNSNSNYYPGYYSGALAVAALNNQDIRSYYSCYGTWVEMSAPGGETHIIDERGVYSTFTTSTYDYLQGTSMACPHVSGTAALIISMAYGELSPSDVKDILKSTTDDVDALNPGYVGELGTGRLNAYQALLETQNYLVTPGTGMPLPPHTGPYSGNTRGYWFTAPTDFTVTGLRVPLDVSGDQTIEIVRFNSGPPPVFSGTTNDFVSLGRWVSVAGSGIISCNICVDNGDVIGILGCRGTTTSYGANNFVTSIDGNAVTLVRMGMQYQLPSTLAQDLWQEPSGGTLGRIEMYYETKSTWTGAISTNWNTAGNWSGLSVPTSCNDVVIPSGCPNYPFLSGNLGINTATYTYDCKSLDINSGASVIVNGADVFNYGQLTVEGALGIGDDFFLYSGSTVDLTGTISLGITTGWYGHADHLSGSIFNQTGGYYYVESIDLNNGCQFNGTGGITSLYVNGDSPPENTIEIDDPDSYFNQINVETGANAALFSCTYDLEATYQVQVFGGILDINSFTINSSYFDVWDDGSLIIDSGGTLNVPSNGPYFHDMASLTMSSGSEINSALNVRFNLGTSENISGGDIFLEGDFTDADNIFTPTGGSVTFDGSISRYIYGSTAFFDLNINKTGATVYADSPFSINNNLVISSGALDPNDNTIDIGGIWTNNVGPTGFVEGAGRVIFDKPTGGIQSIASTEHFNILECATVSSIAGIRPAGGTTVSCNIYDWTSAGVSTFGSTFIANDLEDGSLFGFFYAHANSQIILTKPAGYVDLFGDIIVRDNALVQVNGGGDNSWWSGSGYTNNVTVETGGVLDFVDVGIYIWSAGTLVDDIQAGSTIKVGQDFICERTDFNPDGLLEFQNGTDGVFNVAAGSTLYDVLVNKTGGDKSTYQTKDRKGNLMDNTKGNIVTITSDIVVENDVTIDNGFLVLGAYQLSLGGDWTNNAGDAYFDEGTGTVSFNGTGDVAINNNETFYNLTLDKVNSGDWLNPYGDINVLNDLTVNPGAIYSGANAISVGGNATMNSGGVLYMQSNSSLALGAGSQLVVNSGAAFYAVGSAGNGPLVTHISTGTYGFSVWGTIGAQNAIFEYMDGNGINVKIGATVTAPFPFNYCTFRRGAPAPSALLVLNGSNVFTCQGAIFENTFGNTEHNVWKYYATGDATFNGASGDFAGPEYEHDPNTPPGYIHWGNMDIELELNVMLEGPFNGLGMATDLKTLGLVPLNQPYNSNSLAEWYYTGTESVGSIPANVVDWVLVELRDATDPASAAHGTDVAIQAAFLLNDGSIVDLNGSSNLTFTGVSYDDGLYLVVWHRNHLGIISSDKMPRPGGIYTWDFTLFGAAFTDTNPGTKHLGGGNYGMYAGDASGGQYVNLFDHTLWSVDAGTDGYLPTDFDMDGQTHNVDKNDYYFINLDNNSQVPLSKSTDN